MSGKILCALFLARPCSGCTRSLQILVPVVEIVDIGTFTMLHRWKMMWGSFFTKVYPCIVASSLENYGYLAFNSFRTTIWPAPSRKRGLPASSCGPVHDKLLWPRTFQLGDVRQSPRFQRAERKSLRGLFTAEEAVRSAVELHMRPKAIQKIAYMGPRKKQSGGTDAWGRMDWSVLVVPRHAQCMEAPLQVSEAVCSYTWGVGRC